MSKIIKKSPTLISDNPYLEASCSSVIESELPTEMRKLDFLRKTELRIRKDLLIVSDSNDSGEEDQKTKMYLFKKIFVSFLIAFGLLEDAAGSYLYGSALFLLIPGITNPVVVVMSVIFTILNCAFFYAFEVSILKEAMGIHSKENDIGSIINVYTQQLETTTAINQLLTTIDIFSMDPVLYEEYTKLAVLFNDDVKKKQDSVGSFQESIPRKILKWGVIGFGLLNSISGSYFMSTSLLAVISAPLLGTPIGWLIISLTVVAGLGFYYAMGVTSMIQLVNPDRAQFKLLKKSLHDFKPKNDQDFDAIHTMRRAMRKVSTQDVQTQTLLEEPVIYIKGASLFSASVREGTQEASSLVFN